jgi:regulatory protein
MVKRPPPSLQARALAWLAQREQSRSELRRKLLRVARARNDQAAHGEGADTAQAGPANPADPAQEVERLLDWLASQAFLCEERFVESRVRARAPRAGTRRIEHELAQHGLQLGAEATQRLRDTELRRAVLLWRRKFGEAAQDAVQRARQARFLAGRGFAGDVIRRVIDGTATLDDDDLN